MTKIDKEAFDRIVKLSIASSDDKLEALTLYKKYIDADANFCLKCDTSIRQMFIRLRSWWKNQKTPYTFIKQVESTKQLKKK